MRISPAAEKTILECKWKGQILPIQILLDFYWQCICQKVRGIPTPVNKK